MTGQLFRAYFGYVSMHHSAEDRSVSQFYINTFISYQLSKARNSNHNKCHLLSSFHIFFGLEKKTKYIHCQHGFSLPILLRLEDSAVGQLLELGNDSFH